MSSIGAAGPVAVLVNPTAGRGRHRDQIAGRARRAACAAAATSSCCEPRRRRRPRSPPAATPSPAGAGALVAAGGDGTVNLGAAGRRRHRRRRSGICRSAPATTSPRARPADRSAGGGRSRITDALDDGGRRRRRPGPDGPGRRPGAMVRRGARRRLRRDRQRTGQPDAVPARPAPLRRGDRGRAAAAAARAATPCVSTASSTGWTRSWSPIGNTAVVRRRHAHLPGRRRAPTGCSTW